MSILACRVAAILLLGVAIATTVVGIVVNDRSLTTQTDAPDGWLPVATGLVLGVLATLLVCAIGPSGGDPQRVERGTRRLIVAVLLLAAAIVWATADPVGPGSGDGFWRNRLGLEFAGWLALGALAMAVFALRSVARSGALDFRQAGGFAVSVARLAPLVLEIAAAATVLICLLPADQSITNGDERTPYVALGVGLVLGIVMGVALAPIHAETQAARRASRQRTGEIAARLDRLRVRLDDWCPGGQVATMLAESPAPDDPGGASRSMARQAACRDAWDGYVAVARASGSAQDGDERTARGPGATPWMSGDDAVALISRLQGAEEALLGVAPANQLLAVWHADDAWLAGSTNAGRTDYRFLVRRVVAMIDGRLLPPSPPERPAGSRTPESDMTARVVLRDVRRQMDECLVAQRTELIRVRTEICRVDLLTGLVAYGLVGAVVVTGATAPLIFTTVGVLLVIWTIRIFHRLWLDALDLAQTEHGLATALVRLRVQSLLWVLFFGWTGLLVGIAAAALRDVSIPTKVFSMLVVALVIFSIASPGVGLLEHLWPGSQQVKPDVDLARTWLRFLPRLASVAGIAGVIAFAVLYAFLAEPKVIVLGR